MRCGRSVFSVSCWSVTHTAAATGGEFRVLLQHRPGDARANVFSGVRLQLSGHTHGGHVFPAGQIGMLMRANDLLYGHERRGNTDFIVTSGISGWAIPFKTGCISEYCIIDVEP